MKTKIILPIVLVLVALVAIFFLAPLKAYRDAEKDPGNVYNIMASSDANVPGWKRYLSFCFSYWRTVFTGMYSGGELPEVVVTPGTDYIPFMPVTVS